LGLPKQKSHGSLQPLQGFISLRGFIFFMGLWRRCGQACARFAGNRFPGCPRTPELNQLMVINRLAPAQTTYRFAPQRQETMDETACQGNFFVVDSVWDLF
jgi:hypothetical protein